MADLKTNYKDDVFAGKRKYHEINNGDGTISFDDVTDYTQTGDSYGAAQINEVNAVINTLKNTDYKSTDNAETAIADNDYVPFFDSSANAPRKSLWSNIKNVLSNVFAIKTHSSSQTTFGTGSQTMYGHVKLHDDYTHNNGAASAAVGASSKALYDAYTANKSSIQTLNGTVSILRGDLTNTNTNVTNLTSRVTQAENNITTLSSKETSLENSFTSRMGAAESNISTLTSNVSSLSSQQSTSASKISTLENELTANNKRIYLDYKDGKYGYNTSANRGADTFFPFNKKAKEFKLSLYFNIQYGYYSSYVWKSLVKDLDFHYTEIVGFYVNDTVIDTHTNTNGSLRCHVGYYRENGLLGVQVIWKSDSGGDPLGAFVSADLYIIYYE